MVDQLTFQTIFQFLQTLSIMVGITYYLMILRNQQKSQKLTLETRQATLMMNIFKELTSEKRWEEYVRSIYTIKFARAPLFESHFQLFLSIFQYFVYFLIKQRKMVHIDRLVSQTG